MGMCIFHTIFRISNLKRPLPTKRVTVIKIKVKSRNTFLRMLLVCIGSYVIEKRVTRGHRQKNMYVELTDVHSCTCHRVSSL